MQKTPVSLTIKRCEKLDVPCFVFSAGEAGYRHSVLLSIDYIDDQEASYGSQSVRHIKDLIALVVAERGAWDAPFRESLDWDGAAEILDRKDLKKMLSIEIEGKYQAGRVGIVHSLAND